MPVSLRKTFELGEPQVFCSCGQIMYEIDTLNCAGCGDVTCENCYTDCFDCGKMYCRNCSESNIQCLRCYLNNVNTVSDEKAFLVIDGVNTPIKNSAFMIQKTSLLNARDIRLTLEGVEYKYTYRSLYQRQDDKTKHDYYLFFEKIPMNDKDFEKQVRDALKTFNARHGFEGDEYGEYDDYSTLGW